MRLTYERNRRGWSLAKLARRSDLNATTVGLIESGRFRPYPGQLRKLAKALGLPLAEAGSLVEEQPRQSRVDESAQPEPLPLAKKGARQPQLSDPRNNHGIPNTKGTPT